MFRHHWKPLLGTIILSRSSFSILNLLILLLAISALKLMWFSEILTENSAHHIVELWEGFGTIILGFGVSLEERKSLRRIFSAAQEASREAPVDDHIDSVCHDYGVLFVMVGVITEIFAWLVKIPNEAVNTSRIEMFLMHLAAITTLGGVFLQLGFFYRLWGKRK